jgi:2-methylcitrate dehydratase
VDETSRKLVDFTQNLKFEDLSEKTRHGAKARILDAFGASMAAFETDSVPIVRRLAQPVSSGPSARVFGDLTATSVDMAAFINSCMVRCLDINDSCVFASGGHPSDAIPAVLAVAESLGVSGKDFLLAVVISHEVQCQFLQFVPVEHRGWDQTTNVALGCAMASGKLMGLNDEQLHNALSIAVVPNLALYQTRTGALSMWKGMAGPYGARNGVFAAILAREGVSAPDGVFEGELGLWNQAYGGDKFPVDPPTDFANHTFAIEETTIKTCPIRTGIHIPVYAAQKLREKIDVKDVVALKAELVRKTFVKWVDKPDSINPTSRDAADHSPHFCIAAALIDGNITPETFEKKRYNDQDIKDMIGKLTIELPDEFADETLELLNARLTVTLKNGEEVSASQRWVPKEEARNTTREKIETKFHTLVKRFLPDDARNKLCELAWDLENLGKVDELISLTEKK